ncbi:hypothetical protein FOXYSP1_20128 [Fusarium oxysporum f. sp. phaseoli]
MGGPSTMATTRIIRSRSIPTDSRPQDCHSSPWQTQEHCAGGSGKADYQVKRESTRWHGLSRKQGI